MIVKTVCVIGGGASGICAAKTALQNGMEVTLFEYYDSVGGTWVNRQIRDTETSYGFMYEGLTTDIPKQVMGYSDFEIRTESSAYLTSDQVTEYLKDYANHFNVNQVIKFQHEVIRVNPTKDSKWEIIVINNSLKSKSYETYYFDAVMVCNGHHNVPHCPQFKSQDLFTGQLLHCKDFKRASDFQGQKVLVIGSGASAFDIAVLLSKCASLVILSHHSVLHRTANFPDNVIQRTDVKEFTENGATFHDDQTEENINVVILCTGFLHSFPFLTCDSGITVHDDCIQPLFKHCINIQRPTMAFIGVTSHCLQMQTFDIQSRFCLKFWSGLKELPPQKVMEEDLEREMARKKLKPGWKRWHFHRLLEEQESYFKDLAETAEISGVPQVFINIFNDCIINGILTEYLTYRHCSYEIIDSETFRKY